MKPCECVSYAINPRHHGREEGKLLDLCDVCYWRTIAQEKTHPPQDVEEFIASSSSTLQLLNGSVVAAINPDVVRSFIAKREAGHVRVPVELLNMAIQQMEKLKTFAPIEDSIYANSTMKLLDRILNASKGGGV